MLSVLWEGRAANDLSGSSLTPVGFNALIHPNAPPPVEDFAIGAPFAATRAGEVYVLIGQPGLNTTANQGCISPIRATGCDLIQTLLGNQNAVLITGVAANDEAGFSIAGVGDVIGPNRGPQDGVPDLLIGAPFAAGGLGAAYLVGGHTIAAALTSARTNRTTATIALSDIQVIRFVGDAQGDEFGTSVAGIGGNCYLVGAPLARQGRGIVRVFCGDTARSTIVGPSVGAHLGGVPADELASTTAPFKGNAVSGVRNPALVDPLTAQNNSSLFSVYASTDQDVLLGAPDACVHEPPNQDTAADRADYSCAAPGVIRPGLVYLLSGQLLISTIRTFNLSDHVDLLALSAIVVRGERNGDRLGTSVSAAGDLDGDCGPVTGLYLGCAAGGKSDFMFSAPLNAPGGTGAATEAGKVYVVFGREVLAPGDAEPANDPVPNGNPLVPFQDTVHPGNQGKCLTTRNPNEAVQLGSSATTLFRQCTDGLRVFPLNAGDFETTNLHIGLSLRGEAAGDRLGTSLADGRDFQGPLTFLATNQVRVSDILIGAPFHDVTTPDKRVHPRAGKAYVVTGDTNLHSVSGDFRSMLDSKDFGVPIDGHSDGDNYGICVAAAGNVFDPPGSSGDDILIAANHSEANINNAIQIDVGETELFFGSAGGGVGAVGANPLPFIQPGPYGPQYLIGGFWSFLRQTPLAGTVVLPPLVPSRVRDVTFNVTDPSKPLVLPPAQPPTATSGLFPPGTVGPFAPALPYGQPLFLPGSPPRSDERKVLLPRFLYAVSPDGHLFEFAKAGKRYRVQDLTLLSGAPLTNNGFSGRLIASGRRAVRELFVLDTETPNHTIRYFLGRNRRWSFQDLGVASGTSVLDTITELGVQSR